MLEEVEMGKPEGVAAEIAQTGAWTLYLGPTMSYTILGLSHLPT